jgi:polysaccharide export outer membrane protein
MITRRIRILFIALFLFGLSFFSVARQDPGIDAPRETADGGSNVKPSSDYVLGPDDEIAIHALDAEEISNKPMRIDGDGNINVPMLGRMRAAGFTVRGLEAEIKSKLATYVLEPQVTIFITAYRSQPVSVIGSVRQPGVLQLEGHKTLIEVLSLAGGLSSDAGNILKITRRMEWGKIPLPNATVDDAGQYSIAEINLRGLIDARDPSENIMVMPNDILSVPRGLIVYAMGEVHKPGAFVLADREVTSVLQVLAMAEGLGPTAAGKSAQVLRPVANANRVAIPIDLNAILAGKTPDVSMQPEDILFVPNSYAKGAWRRFLDTTIQAATGIAIYRGW